MINKKLILIGGGGHCKSVIDIAEALDYQIHGILDRPSEVGKKVLGYEVIGCDDDIEKYVDDFVFMITIGHIKDATLRIKLHNLVIEAGGKLATLIASTAYVSRHAVIGEGSIIMHHSMVNADATIGKGSIINTYANVEHDAQIGNFCHISTGAMINGNCVVGSNTFVGSQSVMVNGTEITGGCVIGAGSLVRKNIKIKGVYSGNPAVLKIKL